jgi:hypothetical protein
MSVIKKCRICKSSKLEKILDLGKQYLTGIFPQKNQTIPKGNLTLVICKKCSLVQLKDNFSLSYMFGNSYGYRTGLNSSMVKHINNKADLLRKKVKLNKDDVVIDIGSNDGTLLNSFPSNKKLKLIGVDPTIKKFNKFYNNNINKIDDFFSYSKIKFYLKNRKAKIITSIAMFYDLKDPISFARNIYKSLDHNGIWHLEQSYSGLMLERNSFDTICHEHLEYYSLKSIKKVFDMVGFKIIDINFNKINGGSFAITVAKKNSNYNEIKKKIKKILLNENRKQINSASIYRKFFKKINYEKEKLMSFIKKTLKNNKKIIGYGASTKGNVLLQYYKINNKLIKKICDVNKQKYGKYTPGTNIKIISELDAKKLKPDYYLVLPWHFKEFILKKERKKIKNGIKFIFPLPKFEVIG